MRKSFSIPLQGNIAVYTLAAFDADTRVFTFIKMHFKIHRYAA